MADVAHCLGTQVISFRSRAERVLVNQRLLTPVALQSPSSLSSSQVASETWMQPAAGQITMQGELQRRLSAGLAPKPGCSLQGGGTMHAARAGPQGVPQQTSPLKLGCILGGSAVRQRGQSWLYCLVLGGLVPCLAASSTHYSSTGGGGWAFNGMYACCVGKVLNLTGGAGGLHAGGRVHRVAKDGELGQLEADEAGHLKGCHQSKP